MKAYQTGHQQTNHWADIGYHYVIDRQGRIWEGRELSWKGAHAGNKQANENNVGIALIGNFENVEPPAAAARRGRRAHHVARARVRHQLVEDLRPRGDREDVRHPGNVLPGQALRTDAHGLKRAADRAKQGGAAAGND